MNKFVFLLLLLISPMSLFAETGDWKQIKSQLSSGIVHIYVSHEIREKAKPYREGDVELRMGTGFFIDDGVIVTNQHIIEGAHDIKIEGVATKEKFSVELASEPSVKFDLAILKFTSDKEFERFKRINGPVQTLEWAEWEEARPGQEVSVLGFGHSNYLVATQGIISNWEPRYDVYQRRLDHVTLIRTDAAVNPGNSGGPVVSTSGRIVGISARYGAGENIGLLIPFFTAKQVVETLREKGEFVKAEAGLAVYNTNPVLRDILGLSQDQSGVVVSHVAPDSAADKAGIRQWDILTSVDGYPINHGEIRHPQAGNLPYWFLFNAAQPDTVVNFKVLRDGEYWDAPLKLGVAGRQRGWLPLEGEDYRPEWGYLGGLVITEVTRELLVELEEDGEWRWDLINDSAPAGKIYMVTDVQAGTQAMSYQEYGLSLKNSQIFSINGQPLKGDLSERLDALHQQLAEGKIADTIELMVEGNITIKLNSALLKNDMTALFGRYPKAEKEMLARARTRTAQYSGGDASALPNQIDDNKQLNRNGSSYPLTVQEGLQQQPAAITTQCCSDRFQQNSSQP